MEKKVGRKVKSQIENLNYTLSFWCQTLKKEWAWGENLRSFLGWRKWYMANKNLHAARRCYRMKMVETLVQLISNQVKNVNLVAVSIAISIATITAYAISENVFLIISIFFFALPILDCLVKWAAKQKEKHAIKKFEKKVTDNEWQKKFCEDLSVDALLLLKELNDAEDGKKLNKANRYILELSHYLCVIEVPPTTLEFGQYYSYYALQPWANALVTKQTAFINELLSKEAANENHPH